MKKLYTLLLVAAIISTLQFPTTNCHAQYVTLPDSNFVKWLKSNGYASSMKDDQLDTSSVWVYNANLINCRKNNIHDLTGIQYFKTPH